MFKKMMTAVAGVALLAAVSGCNEPIPADQDPLAQYPQVHVDSYSLKNDIVIQPPVASRVGAGQLKVQIMIRNKTDGDLNLDYKYYFTDTNKVQVEGDKSWLGVRIPRKGIEPIEFTSLTASAADFRVEIRRKKFE